MIAIYIIVPKQAETPLMCSTLLISFETLFSKLCLTKYSQMEKLIGESEYF